MSAGTPISPATRQRLKGLAVPIATALGRLGLTPNGLTIIGFIGTCAAALAAASQAWVLAGSLVIVFGIFDLFDGALARATGRVTKFGAFLDSTLDRTGENLVLAGVGFGCAVAGFPLGVGLAGLAMAFGSIVTYARARAEAIGVHGEVGVAPRPERLVILALGLLLAGLRGGVVPATPVVCGACMGCCPEALIPHDGGLLLALALGLLTLLSTITVIQRIVHVYRQTEGDSNP